MGALAGAGQGGRLPQQQSQQFRAQALSRQAVATQQQQAAPARGATATSQLAAQRQAAATAAAAAAAQAGQPMAAVAAAPQGQRAAGAKGVGKKAVAQVAPQVAANAAVAAQRGRAFSPALCPHASDPAKLAPHAACNNTALSCIPRDEHLKLRASVVPSSGPVPQHHRGPRPRPAAGPDGEAHAQAGCAGAERRHRRGPGAAAAVHRVPGAQLGDGGRPGGGRPRRFGAQCYNRRSAPVPQTAACVSVQCRGARSLRLRVRVLSHPPVFSLVVTFSAPLSLLLCCASPSSLQAQQAQAAVNAQRRGGASYSTVQARQQANTGMQRQQVATGGAFGPLGGNWLSHILSGRRRRRSAE